ncbi:hypothetical protein SH668x_001003 [Planctomicrobium sp. SH668]|uniref:hypothetical protein n=1 Tax=Planctomicrobium sp. SH668 TaxID=3448126 RepID=UPI003F5BC39C
MLKITVQSDARNLLLIAEELDRGSEDVLTAIGTELLGYIAEDFEAKSRGKVGAGGIQWDPLTAARIKQKAKRAKKGDTSTQIGIDTGVMANSISPKFAPPDGQGGNVFEVTGHAVEVGYGRTYAKHFDKLRTLIPEELPQDWIDGCEEIVQAWIDDLWNRRIRN